MAENITPHKEEYLRLLALVGKAGINALFPNDFELYLITLELVDSDNRSVDSLIFPVNPTSLEEAFNNIVSIQKTSQGVSVLKTQSFIPVNISLSGNFGRRFKFLVGKGVIDATALATNLSFEGKAEPQEFNAQIKTGYGVTKLLEKIIRKSNTLDSKGNPYRLYFYNLPFGTAYVVESVQMKFSQQFPQSNMIWEYNLSFTAIAPLVGNLVNDKKKLTTLTSLGTVQKGINLSTKNLGNELTRLIKNAI